MKGHFRYIFIVCFIMGFHLRVPVTMLPANTNHKEVGEYIRLDNVGVGDRLVVDENRKFIPFNNGNEFTQSQPAIRDRLRSNILIGSKTYESQFLNSEVNPSHSIDRHEFNNTNSIRRLETDLVDLVANKIQSPNSVIKSQLRDLTSTRLEQIQQRFQNLSATLQIIKGKLTVNNLPVPATETEANLDSGVWRANNAIRQIEHISPTQTGHVNSTDSKSLHYRPVNGITWSRDLEDRCPVGFQKQAHDSWKTKVAHLDISRIEPGCGSMQNRLVTFNDSRKACARYRLNNDQMQGEIYSYYLSKRLGMNYVPPTSLQTVKHSHQWRAVWDDVVASRWSENNPVIFTEWVESLEPVYMPDELKNKQKLQQENDQLGGKAESSLCNLLQWTDLIVFDYISANLDRIINNMVNLKWNKKMLEKPIHNLEKSKKSGLFIWIDNESGLFHGYRLLESYNTYHQSLLDSICIFRQSTIDAIKTLHENGNAGEQLQALFEANEVLHRDLPRMSVKNMHILQSRIDSVHKQITLCEQRNY